MTETTPVSAAELLAYLLTQYERAVSIHAQVRMDTDEDRRLHADAVAALRRAAEPVARYLDSAARKPPAVADVPAGQGAASLYLWRDPVGGELDLYFKHADGRVVMIGITLDQLSGATTAALTDHLAATLPTVTTEEPRIRSVDTADGVRHYDDTGREYRAVKVDGELTYRPIPVHVTLARKAQAAGLIVTHLMPAPPYYDRYDVQLWQPDGTLWAEGRESGAMIRAHIHHWPAHQRALTEGAGLRLVIPGDGAALTCGCLTNDTTEESK